MSQKPLSPNPNYKWMVMIVVMIGMIMAMLDSSIVNVSIPAIMADLFITFLPGNGRQSD